MNSTQSALSGVRILDFGWAGVGGLTTKYLADFGAQVIKVETRKHPDIVRMGEPFAGGKRHPDAAFLYLQCTTFWI